MALRTIYNYVIEREDGTTAAERFFRVKPRGERGLRSTCEINAGFEQCWEIHRADDALELAAVDSS